MGNIHKTWTAQAVEKAFERIATWKRGDQRAPHKPLLLLVLLARVQRGEGPLMPYAEVDTQLRDLLEKFGPPRKALHPEYPFWRLQTDGLWTITRRDCISLTNSGDPRRRDLLDQDVAGGFIEPVYQKLVIDPGLGARLVGRLLTEHFPGTYHPLILAAIGWPEAPIYEVTCRRKRAQDFHEQVLAAYGYRCAICGFDLRLAGQPIALEAAHIQWHAYQGPDEVRNGLCLCKMHHALLDLGAWGFTLEGTLQISPKVSRGNGWQAWLGRFDGQPLLKPLDLACEPAPAYVRWHGREVFGM